ncbi:M1 family metallopeptidase [Amycolatopsis sp. NPDC059027]|uniref:M1 family metallopeptidase n=1 Tax=unclassified Amycolatopsis TaxID=2618356 RepID=UPI00366B38EC
MAGTGDYDALDYTVSLEYRSATKDMDGTTTLRARATQPLSRFALDFAGGKVGKVTVDGRRTRFETRDEKLYVFPRELARGAEFTVTVDYTVTRTNGPDGHGPWREIEDGFAISPQTHETMHHVFPCKNDIADKATYTVNVIAPARLTGVTNGDLVETTQLAGDRTARKYRMAYPMPVDDGQIAVGPYSRMTRSGPDGVTIRDVVPTAQAGQLRETLGRTDDQLRWLTAKLGAYPFGTYGLFAPLGSVGAFESQTMSTIDAATLASGTADYVRVHELNHQWFGASVSPKTLADNWIAEGHAHFYGAWYDAELSHPGSADAFAESMRMFYGMDQHLRDVEGPPAAPKPVSGQTQRANGALALYALRQTVGPQLFEKIERAVVTRFKDGVASTADYIRTAREVSGRDVTALLTDWLYAKKTPPMPGHPDWKSDAVAS